LNLDIADNYGKTLLHEAVRFANFEVMEWLIEKGANMELKTLRELQMPLHYAARFDTIEAFEILFNAGGLIINN